ncbi:MAG: hypothetical protein EAZ59_28505 [Oscillatoriales cyanobacterium]|nr:MAG: hypothetical protein EAZ59_28505 [Oscillatoriales cyanobacterium]
MANLSIPKEHYAKFQAFIHLSEENKRKLFSSLQNTDEINPEILVNYLQKTLTEVNPKIVQDVVKIYLNLFNAKNSFDEPLEDFMMRLKAALENTEEDSLKPTEQVLLDFEKLLNTAEIRVAKAKLLESMTDNPKSAKIVEDINCKNSYKTSN